MRVTILFKKYYDLNKYDFHLILIRIASSIYLFSVSERFLDRFSAEARPSAA